MDRLTADRNHGPPLGGYRDLDRLVVIAAEIAGIGHREAAAMNALVVLEEPGRDEATDFNHEADVGWGSWRPFGHRRLPQRTRDWASAEYFRRPSSHDQFDKRGHVETLVAESQNSGPGSQLPVSTTVPSRERLRNISEWASVRPCRIMRPAMRSHAATGLARGLTAVFMTLDQPQQRGSGRQPTRWG